VNGNGPDSPLRITCRNGWTNSQDDLDAAPR
jgi:hypothetical protein